MNASPWARRLQRTQTEVVDAHSRFPPRELDLLGQPEWVRLGDRKRSATSERSASGNCGSRRSAGVELTERGTCGSACASSERCCGRRCARLGQCAKPFRGGLVKDGDRVRGVSSSRSNGRAPAAHAGCPGIRRSRGSAALRLCGSAALGALQDSEYQGARSDGDRLNRSSRPISKTCSSPSSPSAHEAHARITRAVPEEFAFAAHAVPPAGPAAVAALIQSTNPSTQRRHFS
jgi:hypothetical protein